MEKFFLKFKNLKLLIALSLIVTLSSLNNKLIAQITGSTCGDPITITNLPFNDGGNTQDYGNNYTLNDVPPVAPGAVTDGTGSNDYLGSGNDVVYELIAPSTGTISINMTNDNSWASLWVFTGCPFSSTVGYHTAYSGTSRSINNLPVSAGTAYYIVVSNWDAGPINYTINITGDISFFDCEGTPDPGNTIASANPVCPTINFSLSLENTTS
ncbi:MAG: hypothetical protein M0Q45_10995, partial [Bacteroidales bacterium]|nr:hypothetical protein [Bacteroidales bacterium]